VDPCQGNCRRGGSRKLYLARNLLRIPDADNSESFRRSRHVKSDKMLTGAVSGTENDIPSSDRSCRPDRAEKR
jgi:hypothetical protein